MTDPGRIRELIARHRAFWTRSLDQPLVNIDCSVYRRTQQASLLPREWDSKDGMILEPGVLQPERHQPGPMTFDGESRIRGEVVFNTLFAYHRIPWLAGIMGCRLQISAKGQLIWPLPYAEDNWHEQEDQGLRPRMEWLDKLHEFLRHVIERYWPDQCVPTIDNVVRGPGDLILHVLGPERFYTGMYDYPAQLKRLLDRISDLYILWAQSQLKLLPRFADGYCNQYGLWCPGTCLRTQEDFAVHLSQELFDEFLMASVRKVAAAFDYQVFHTHSGFSSLAEWGLAVDSIKCIEVNLDPHGPPIQELVPLWNRILDKKSLIIVGPATQKQLDMMVAKLSPDGLMLDIKLVTEQELSTAWD